MVLLLLSLVITVTIYLLRNKFASFKTVVNLTQLLTENKHIILRSKHLHNYLSYTLHISVIPFLSYITIDSNVQSIATNSIVLFLDTLLGSC